MTRLLPKLPAKSKEKRKNADSMSAENDDEVDKKVPLFGTWPRWYAFLLGFLAVQIILYFLLTNTY